MIFRQPEMHRFCGSSTNSSPQCFGGVDPKNPTNPTLEHLPAAGPPGPPTNIQTGKAKAVMGAGSKAPGVAPIITGKATKASEKFGRFKGETPETEGR